MEGIVIRTALYKESSKILTILTPDSIETVISRGCNKINSPLSNISQTLMRIEYIRSEKSIYTLIEGKLIDSFDEIRFDLKKNQTLALIFKHISLINEFTPLFYTFILKTIEALKIFDYKSVYLMFKIKLLYFLGLKPNFKCICGNENVVFIDIQEGQAKCMNCSSNFDIENTNLIKKMYQDKLFSVELNESEYINILKIIKKYYQIHANFQVFGEEML